jgi:DNA polymerase III alpha subunit
MGVAGPAPAGFPRHLSQHPGGFVIARGQAVAPGADRERDDGERSVIQWDKDDLEELGLMKVDVLALGMLSMLRRGSSWWACAAAGVRDAGHPADDRPPTT